MRSNATGVLLAVLALAFAGAAYYYWSGAGKPANEVVAGVVVEKVQREPGTESGGRTLDQGLRVLTGDSFQQDMYYFLVVETDSGGTIEMAVPREVFAQVAVGDRVQRSSPNAVPVVIERAPEPWAGSEPLY